MNTTLILGVYSPPSDPQTILLLRNHIDSLIQQHNGPIILSGDFNARLTRRLQ